MYQGPLLNFTFSYMQILYFFADFSIVGSQKKAIDQFSY